MSRYNDAASFRQALEARLKRTAGERHLPLNSLRQKVVMERLLARLFASPDAPWRLKGGFAMELRLAGRARTTRDLDLAAFGRGTSPTDAHDILLSALREAAEDDPGDFLEFAIRGLGRPLAGQQPGGYRFGVRGRLAGGEYASFHLDVGFDADPFEAPERLACEDHLAFAGVAPATVLAVPPARQFAEKIHALTRPWADRTNTRTKDLVDLVLLLDLGISDHASLRTALVRVFEREGGHRLPETLPLPSATWREEFGALARQVDLALSLDEAHARVASFWQAHRLGEAGRAD